MYGKTNANIYHCLTPAIYNPEAVASIQQFRKTNKHYNIYICILLIYLCIIYVCPIRSAIQHAQCIALLCVVHIFFSLVSVRVCVCAGVYTYFDISDLVLQAHPIQSHPTRSNTTTMCCTAVCCSIFRASCVRACTGVYTCFDESRRTTSQTRRISWRRLASSPAHTLKGCRRQ